jgi:hypothetical protein
MALEMKDHGESDESILIVNKQIIGIFIFIKMKKVATLATSFNFIPTNLNQHY